MYARPFHIKLLFLIALTLVGCFRQTASIKGRILFVPPNYVGEVFIEYGVPSASPLPIENGWQVVVIPMNGWVQTSSDIEAGWRYPDQLYFWNGKTRTRADTVVPGYTPFGNINGVWDCPGMSLKHSQIEKFFLGTEAQWKATSYKSWASIHCPVVANEKSWPNNDVVPMGTPGIQ